jgi:hypothetical protein
MRHFPFVPYPPLALDVLVYLRGRLPSSEIRDGLLQVFETTVRTHYLPALTVEYVQDSLIPKAIGGSGEPALLCLSTLFSLMAIGALFAVDGPNEAQEVSYYSRTATEGIAAMGVLASPSLWMIEAVYSRVMLELFRQGSQEEPTRCMLAVASHMCLSVCLSYVNTGAPSNIIYS